MKTSILLLCIFFSGTIYAAKSELATFAGGCFWCMEHPFDEIDGVKDVISGYTGGEKKNPTYEEVSSGTTGHAEAVQVTLNPKKVSFKKLLEVYWRQIDPFAKDAQFCDHGTQYRSAIFYHSKEQKELAEKSKEILHKSHKVSAPFQTEIVSAGKFYPAEDYHQDYYKKNPVRYNFYRSRCGRDARLKEVWGEGKESVETMERLLKGL